MKDNTLNQIRKEILNSELLATQDQATIKLVVDMFYNKLQNNAIDMIKKKHLLKLRNEFGKSTGPFITSPHEFKEEYEWGETEAIAWIIKKIFNIRGRKR